MAEKYQPPPNPPPGYSGNPDVTVTPSGFRGILGSSNPFRRNQQQSGSSEQPPSYAPPPGPPPKWFGNNQTRPENDYAPPPGPPPGRSASTNEFAPPPGPPPGHGSSDPEPPPYDPWMAVPDNALLPPPPSFKQDTSPTANADYDDAARAHAWIRANPLWQAQPLPPQTLARMSHGDVHLTSPPNTKNVTVSQRTPGTTNIRTTPKCTDSIFLSDIPVYSAQSDSPLVTEKAKTVYFELLVKTMGSNNAGSGDAGIAIGFAALPYPFWRLPGWHRGSLGVHGDDGRRYVDDSYGGMDFTHSFSQGDIVGIGMVYSLPSGYTGGKPRCEVFFTRNGSREGGWNLHEEKDGSREEGDVTGLEGEHDLLAAVGCFGQVEFETRFRREEWNFRP